MAAQNLKLNVGLRTKSVLIALTLGVVFGLGLNYFNEMIPGAVNQIIEILGDCGQLFISLMKMLVIPVVFVSIVCGCSALADKASLRQTGLKALFFYIMTTVLALLLALSVAAWVDFPAVDSFNVASSEQISSLSETMRLSIIPDNFLGSFSRWFYIAGDFCGTFAGYLFNLCWE